MNECCSAWWAAGGGGPGGATSSQTIRQPCRSLPGQSGLLRPQAVSKSVSSQSDLLCTLLDSCGADSQAHNLLDCVQYWGLLVHAVSSHRWEHFVNRAEENLCARSLLLCPMLTDMVTVC